MFGIYIILNRKQEKLMASSKDRNGAPRRYYIKQLFGVTF